MNAPSARTNVSAGSFEHGMYVWELESYVHHFESSAEKK
jgi:hypothetical protein